MGVGVGGGVAESMGLKGMWPPLESSWEARSKDNDLANKAFGLYRK